MNGTRTDRAAAERAHFDGLTAAERAEELAHARTMLADGTDADLTDADVRAEAARAAFAGTDAARADDRARAAAAAAERAAHATRALTCSECGGETDARARLELAGTDLVLCLECALADGGSETLPTLPSH